MTCKNCPLLRIFLVWEISSLKLSYISSQKSSVELAASFAEFMVVMYVMSNGTPEENFKQIFRILDADGNGVITLRGAFQP